MYGTLAGALSGRKIYVDREKYTAEVEGRIAGYGKTIRIEAITVHYNLPLPADTSPELVERVLKVHPQGCPAHQSVKSAIEIIWDAKVQIGDEEFTFESESETEGAAGDNS